MEHAFRIFNKCEVLRIAREVCDSRNVCIISTTLVQETSDKLGIAILYSIVLQYNTIQKRILL